jgi:hypothetical protein
MTTRITLLLAALIFQSACGGGEGSKPDGATDSSVNVDSAQSVEDGDLLDAEEKPDGEIEDAALDAPMVDPCLDAGVAISDAGSTTVGAACTSYCGSFVPLCSVAIPGGSGNCMSYCETTLTMGLNGFQLARAVACQQINSAGQCEAALTCLALAATCM